MKLPAGAALADADKTIDEFFPDVPEAPCVPCTIHRPMSPAQQAISQAKGFTPMASQGSPPGPGG